MTSNIQYASSLYWELERAQELVSSLERQLSIATDEFDPEDYDVYAKYTSEPRYRRS